MNREDIIRMAREAGFNEFTDGLRDDGSRDTYLDCWPEQIERFAALVIQEDREKLAKAIQALPFGDTASSFARFVREFKP